MLCLLDLSAAFDSLQHSVLVHGLKGIGDQDPPIEWFQSYLSDSRIVVKIKDHVPEPQVVKYGVQEWSVLDIMLFNVYCISLSTLIR